MHNLVTNGGSSRPRKKFNEANLLLFKGRVGEFGCIVRAAWVAWVVAWWAGKVSGHYCKFCARQLLREEFKRYKMNPHGLTPSFQQTRGAQVSLQVAPKRLQPFGLPVGIPQARKSTWTPTNHIQQRIWSFRSSKFELWSGWHIW
jgi:hypothetical protein